MTDATDFTASDGGTSFAPDQIAGAREHWISMGLDVAAFDAAMAPPSDDLAALAGGSLAAKDVPAVELPADFNPNAMTPQQAQKLAAERLRVGVPADRVEAALKADGFDPTDPDAPDTRTDEQKEFDAFFGPPPTPSDYQVQYVNRLPEGVEVSAVAQFNRLATEWAAAIGFPANVGGGVIERALDVGQRANRMSDVELALWKREQRTYLEGLVGGPDKLEEKLALARTALQRAPAGFTGVLKRVSVLDDAGMVMLLANQAERLAARG